MNISQLFVKVRSNIAELLILHRANQYMLELLTNCQSSISTVLQLHDVSYNYFSESIRKLSAVDDNISEQMVVSFSKEILGYMENLETTIRKQVSCLDRMYVQLPENSCAEFACNVIEPVSMINLLVFKQLVIFYKAYLFCTKVSVPEFLKSYNHPNTDMQDLINQILSITKDDSHLLQIGNDVVSMIQQVISHESTGTVSQ